MKEHEFVAAVGRTAGLENADRAATAVRAVLSVLGQRLAGDEPREVASQLPPSIAEALPATGAGGTFGVEEFYRRVAAAEGEGCTQDSAREHTRAVIAALKAAITKSEFDDLAAQLPGDYRQDVLATASATDRH